MTRHIQMCLLAVGPAKRDQVLLLINPGKGLQCIFISGQTTALKVAAERESRRPGDGFEKVAFPGRLKDNTSIRMTPPRGIDPIREATAGLI